MNYISSTQPKYKILSDWIKDNILNGTFSNGQKLSSENELSEKFGISRQTVRQAIGILESEGFLTRIKGSGTYVNCNGGNNNRTMTIGVIMTYITDYIFPDIVRGIEDVLSSHEYGIQLSVTKNKVAYEAKILQSFIEKGVDGIIVEGTKTALPNPNIPLFRKLDQIGIPYIFVNGYYRELSPAYVVTNDRGGGLKLAEYLIKELGHISIGGIFKSDDMQGHERYAGFASALFENGIEINEDVIVWYSTSDLSLLFSPANEDALVERFKDCSAIVCYNDEIAIRLIEILLRHNIDVPGMISVASFDNSKLSDLSPVKITSLNHPKDELGREVATRLLNIIGNRTKDVSLVMDMDLIIKNSTVHV